MPLGPIFLSLAHFAAIPIILKAVTEEEYGYLGVLLGFYNIIVYLLAFNASGKLAVLIVNKPSVQKKEFEAYAVFVYRILLIFSFVFVLALTLWVSSSLMPFDVLILCFLAYFQNVNLLKITSLQFEKKTLLYITYFSILAFFSLILTLLFTTFFSFGVTGRLFALLSATCIGHLYLSSMDKADKKPFSHLKAKWAAQSWKNYSLPLMPHILASTLFTNVDRLIISGSPLASELARFYLAVQMAAPILIVANALNVFMKVRVFDRLSGGHNQALDKFAWLYISAILMFSLLLLGLVSFLEQSTEILVGIKVIDILIILIIGHVIQAIYFLLSNRFLYYERGDLVSIASIFGVFFHVLAAVFVSQSSASVHLYSSVYVISSCIFLVTLSLLSKRLSVNV